MIAKALAQSTICVEAYLVFIAEPSGGAAFAMLETISYSIGSGVILVSEGGERNPALLYTGFLVHLPLRTLSFFSTMYCVVSNYHHHMFGGFTLHDRKNSKPRDTRRTAETFFF